MARYQLDPDDPRPTYQRVTDVIREFITGEQMRPGYQLPSRFGLAAMFGVSHMTVGRALRVLQDDGVVVIRPNSGTFVRRPGATPRNLAAEIDALRARVEALEHDFR